MRQGKHDMEVGGVDDFRPALINPELFGHCLTVGAVPVAAGIIVELHMPAFRTCADVHAELAGLAGQNRMGSPLLFF